MDDACYLDLLLGLATRSLLHSLNRLLDVLTCRYTAFNFRRNGPQNPCPYFLGGKLGIWIYKSLSQQVILQLLHLVGSKPVNTSFLESGYESFTITI